MANQGTIFLDEFGDISPLIQLKLLRVLQEGTFEKVGGEETIKVNVRVISATNKNIREEIQKCNFREDLYYRLSVVPVNLPTLKERRGD
ncbi:MAG: sigma 54-interacting transcriptional regulator, partial [Deltaproteobacteria bacterium]|nr:sigma 54-interacting transcriptional regulator [Deltaproteobacteria bacterium]